MNWATKRKLYYFSGLLGFLLVVIGIPSYFLLYEPPTCFDGKKNGEEAGIDCGGSCEKVCPFQATDLIIHWDKAFEVRPSSWGVVAVIENPNNAVAFGVPYAFKLLDENGILISEVTGEAFIPAGQRFAIFESGVEVGNRRPVQEFFEFDLGNIVWLTPTEDKLSVEVLETRLSESSSETRLEARLSNPQVAPVENVEAIGILYDIDGNMVASSETFVDIIEGEGNRAVIFTWPGNFSASVTRREVLVRILPE